MRQPLRPRHRQEAWLKLAGPRRVATCRLDAGEILFRQGDPVSALYLIESGQVRLVRTLADGSAVTLHVAREGETFAEASLFSDAYHCEAVAEMASRLTVIAKADALAAMARHSGASLGLARLLASQVRDLRALLEVRNIRSAPERILAWLRLRAEGSPPTVTLDRTWTKIAAELGLTREAVYRGLGRLEREGAIRRAKSRVVIVSVAASPDAPSLRRSRGRPAPG